MLDERASVRAGLAAGIVSVGAGWGKVIVNLSFGAVLAVVGLWHYRCSNPLTYKISLGSWAHRTYLKSPVLFVVESFAEGFLIYLGGYAGDGLFPRRLFPVGLEERHRELRHRALAGVLYQGELLSGHFRIYQTQRAINGLRGHTSRASPQDME